MLTGSLCIKWPAYFCLPLEFRGNRQWRTEVLQVKKTVVFKQKTLAWQNVPNIDQFPVTLFMFEGHFSEEKKNQQDRIEQFGL